jgi:hypothetical protein
MSHSIDRIPSGGKEKGAYIEDIANDDLTVVVTEEDVSSSISVFSKLKLAIYTEASLCRISVS